MFVERGTVATTAAVPYQSSHPRIGTDIKRWCVFRWRLHLDGSEFGSRGCLGTIVNAIVRLTKLKTLALGLSRSDLLDSGSLSKLKQMPHLRTLHAVHGAQPVLIAVAPI